MSFPRSNYFEAWREGGDNSMADHDTMSEDQLLSKYRSHIMGYAILLVVSFHSSVITSQEPFVTLRYLNVGSVDMFMFLSGMGIYQSLKRNDIVRSLIKSNKYFLNTII